MERVWEWLEQQLETSDDPLPKCADVVIALGSALSPDGRAASPQSRANTLKAVGLFRDGHAVRVLLAGGNRCGNLCEAEAMAREVRDLLPSELLVLETLSRHTAENAAFTRVILERCGWKSAIIVAQQWHARRVRATFRKQWRGSGVSLTVVKARSPYGGASQRRFAHFLTLATWDTLAFLYYRLRGYA